MRRLTGLIHEEEDPFGPGTDLIISLVAFLLLILAVAAILYHRMDTQNQSAAGALAQRQEENARLSAEASQLHKENAKLAYKLDQANKRIEEYERQPPPQPPSQSFPPFIQITGAEGHEFPSGQAVLTPQLKAYIQQSVVQQIENGILNLHADTIMVIGHTDGQPVGAASSSNLDNYDAQSILENKEALNVLKPSSNVDLGMMRALAVIAELRRIQREEHRLIGINADTGFRAYSAGPFLTKNGSWAPAGNVNDGQRRRIEIRFLKREQGL